MKTNRIGVENKRLDILFIIKTIGLEFDDRVRKECLSLLQLGKKLEILVLDESNKKQSGMTSYKVPYQSIRLISRFFYPQAHGLFIKTLEMYYYSIIYILKKRPITIWIHNIETMGLVPFITILKKVGFIKRFVWDQHELPPESMFSKWNGKFLNRIISSCDTIIVANKERMEYLSAKLEIQEKNKIKVLANFPDRTFVSIPKSELPKDILKWLDGYQYILAQGGANPDRYTEKVIEAIILLKKIKLIIVGPFLTSLKKSLENKYGVSFYEFILFAGMYPQMELGTFIDHALASLVLYNSGNPNSLLCASNRMYQAAVRGTPVLVGSNPPMANFVRKNRVGIVLKSDGRYTNDIIQGIKSMTNKNDLVDFDNFNKNSFLWENQEHVIQKILSI